MRLFICLLIFGVLYNGFASPIPSGPQPKSQAPSQRRTRRAAPGQAKIYKCTLSGCKRIVPLTGPEHLRSHINAVHLKKKPFACEDCGAKFPDTTGLKRHKKNVPHPNKEQPPGAVPDGHYCEFCKTRIIRDDHFKDHLGLQSHWRAVEKANILKGLAGMQPAPLQAQHPQPEHQPHGGQSLPVLHPEPGRPALLPSPHQPMGLVHQSHGGQADPAQPRKLPILLPIPRLSVGSHEFSGPSDPSRYKLF